MTRLPINTPLDSFSLSKSLSEKTKEIKRQKANPNSNYSSGSSLQKNQKSEIGTITIQSTRNNTILTLLDGFGKVKGWSSAGSVGCRNSRKSTTHGAEMAAAVLADKARLLGLHTFRVKLKGLGHGKQRAVSALNQSGLCLLEISEQTPSPHNGCRPPRQRRT